MNTIKVAGQYILVGVATLSLMLSAILPVIASAAQVTERSIALSTASVRSTNVTYEVNFDAVDAASAFVIDFCANTPLIGQACTPAAGFSAAGAGTTTAGYTVESATATRIVVESEIAAAQEVSVEITGITNPEVSGPLYARIVTFEDLASATASTPDNLGENTVDDGSVAISITPTIGVSGTVLETMTFCVSAEEIPANCSAVVAPVLQLGDEISEGEYALSQDEINEGSIFTQISTNASGGAVIRLKSNALNCGGLLRAGAPGACDIAPALDPALENGGLVAGDNSARFGVMLSESTDTPAVNATGFLLPVSGSIYSTTAYAMNFIVGNEQGVTSTYGDPFLDTANEPANNKNMELTFGVTVGNDTPAGSYSADLSFIAVGKF